MATKEQLQAMQAAAVIYCQHLGIDPRLEVPQPHPIIKGATISRPMWEMVAERMWDLSLLLASMKMATQQKAAAAETANPFSKIEVAR